MSETATPTTRSLMIAAQAWCAPECGSIEMDSRLATAFAVILDRELSAPVSQKVREVLEAVKSEKMPSYHDCIDDGLPKCAWCLVDEALTLLAPDTRTEYDKEGQEG